MSAVPAQSAVEPIAVPRALVRATALPVLFVAATVYHFLQSRGHATPTELATTLDGTKRSQRTSKPPEPAPPPPAPAPAPEEDG